MVSAYGNAILCNHNLATKWYIISSRLSCHKISNICSESMEKRKRCEKPTGGYRCNACLQSFKEIELFKTHCQQAHNIVTMMNKSLMGAGLKRYEKQSQKVTPPQ